MIKNNIDYLIYCLLCIKKNTIKVFENPMVIDNKKDIDIAINRI